MKHAIHAVSLLMMILCCQSVFGQIRINEVIHATNRVEIKNYGAQTVDVANYWLCTWPSYQTLSSGNVCGNTMLAPGALLTVTVFWNISPNAGEMALYINSNFDSQASIVDYVQWGSGNHFRCTVAQGAGIWTCSDFVPAWSSCASIEYDGSLGNSSANWIPQDNATTPCVENSLDGCGGPANCNITGAGLANVMCNNNGTPSNPNDDFITFSLNPTGMDLGNGYSVSVNMGTITPGGGNYGAPTNFSLNPGSAGNGNVVVTITDNSDPTCTFMVTVVDPGSCSNQCNITGAGLANISCNDNGTPVNPADDFIQFTLNPSGMNLSSGYSVSVNMGTIMPGGGNYGAPTAFSLNPGSAGGGNVIVTITDNADPLCTFMVTVVDPGSCSSQCSFTGTGLANVMCNDNGTPSNPADDFITFTLNPSGINLSAGYSVSVNIGTIMPGGGSYGAPIAFSLNPGSAGGGNVIVTIIDNGDPFCSIDDLIVDPGSCSNACNITGAGLAGVSCNDNGTSADDTDDFITFTLNPAGMNLSAGYSVAVSAGTIMPGGGNYGAPVAFSLNPGSAGGGNVQVTITDNAVPSCTFVATINDPGSCSGTCNITDAGLADVACNDNDTPVDPDDDFITFTLNPSGMNLSAGYSVAVSAGTIMPGGGNYGAPVAFSLNPGSAGGGNVQVTITDNADPSCTFVATINDPGSCSGTCNITDAGLADVACNDNDTPVDPNDDFITFTLNPSGSNLAGGYSVVVNVGTIEPENGVYGMPASFTLNAGSAGAGDVEVTITDNDDPSCTFVVTITDPGSCSGACVLEDAGLDAIVCHSDGTSDPSDDYISFTLNPSGLNLSMGYTVSVSSGTIEPETAMYGSDVTFTLNEGSAGAGDVIVTMTDMGDPECQITVDITDPGPCSECIVMGGTISTSDPASVCVDDGEPDDVDVEVSGHSGENFAWIFTDAMGVITDLPDGPPFDFEGSDSGICLIWHISYEDGLEGLEIDENLADLDGCFDLSNAITITKLTGEDCDACIVDGGLISTTSETFVCLSDDEPDFIDAEVVGNSGPNNAWVVTDVFGTILKLPGEPPFDFGEAGPGVCLVWHVSYEDGLEGLSGGNNINDLIGCYDLSNSFMVTRVQPDGGEISTSDFTMVCVDDGMPAVINISLTGNIGAGAAWVITDADGVIEALPAGPLFDFEGTGPGVSMIWHLSYDGDLEGLETGEHVDDLSGCYHLSNAIDVTKLTDVDCEVSTYNPDLAERIAVFPVPAADRLYIVPEDIIISEIRVYNLPGQIILTQRGNDSGYLNIRDVPAGIYHLVIETNLGRDVRKVIFDR